MFFFWVGVKSTMTMMMNFDDDDDDDDEMNKMNKTISVVSNNHFR